jgi:hypothetical protein
MPNPVSPMLNGTPTAMLGAETRPRSARPYARSEISSRIRFVTRPHQHLDVVQGAAAT